MVTCPPQGPSIDVGARQAFATLTFNDRLEARDILFELAPAGLMIHKGVLVCPAPWPHRRLSLERNWSHRVDCRWEVTRGRRSSNTSTHSLGLSTSLTAVPSGPRTSMWWTSAWRRRVDVRCGSICWCRADAGAWPGAADQHRVCGPDRHVAVYPARWASQNRTSARQSPTRTGAAGLSGQPWPTR